MRRSKFRPCIDLHDGKVKQIVGGTLHDDNIGLKTNFIANESSSYYARLYANHNLSGGHIIKLGESNDDAALEALYAWPNGLQLGGGVTIENAQYWLNSGASKVIVTSWLFPESKFDEDRLRKLSEKVGTERLVVDLSCRATDNSWVVATNKWNTRTEFEINLDNIENVGRYCSELLVHAADMEGLCRGIDQNLVSKLALWSKIPVTYAGGASSISDLDLVNYLSEGKVDLTFGSALDIFGGNSVSFEELVLKNR